MIDSRNPLAYPAHDGHRHGVSERLVARAIGSGLVAVGDLSIAARKTLEGLALLDRQSTDCTGPCWFGFTA